MSRRPTDEIKSDVDVLLPDNTTGLITPAVVRQMLKDTIDSLRPAFAALIADHTGAPVALELTTNWLEVGGATLWNIGAIQSDPLELSADVTSGRVTIEFGGYNHVVRGSANIDAPPAQEIQFAFGYDGVPGPNPISIDGAGGTRIVYVAAEKIIVPATHAQLSMFVRVPSGTATINVHQARLIVELFTTRYL